MLRFDKFERITDILEQFGKELGSVLEGIPMATQLRSIKGLGTIYFAAILFSAGDLRQYAQVCQLLKRAGLNLVESMSGKHKGDRAQSVLNVAGLGRTLQAIVQDEACKRGELG